MPTHRSGTRRTTPARRECARPIFHLVLACTYLLALLAHGARSSPANPPPPQRNIVRYTLELSEGLVWTDGNPTRGVLINGTSPGPLLRASVGDVLLVNVINACTDQNITVHWHGLAQSVHPRSDGTPLVSQWPIAPGNRYEYEIWPSFDDIGTYFYHSHVELQALTAHGPLVIEGPIPPQIASLGVTNEAERERVLMIEDYFHRSASDIAKGLLADPFVWPGSASSLAVNGRSYPRMDCNETFASAAGVQCADRPVDADGPEVIRVGFDETVRLRFIGAMALMYQAIGIFNHTLDLFVADGAYLEPFRLETLEIGPGQRYDALLHTKSRAEVEADGSNGCYWIRAESKWRKPGAQGWALLAYPPCQVACDVATSPPATAPMMSNVTVNGAAVTSGPSSSASNNVVPPPPGGASNNASLLPPEQFGWVAGQLRLLDWEHARRLPPDTSVTRRVFIDAQQVGWFTSKNGTRWTGGGGNVYDERFTTGVPYLVQLYQRQALAPSYERGMANAERPGFDATSGTWTARGGEVLDIVIINNASAKSHNVEVHTWHLHSLKAFVLAAGAGNFSDDALAEARRDGNFERPVARDTATLWPGPGATITNQTLPSQSSGGWTVFRYEVKAEEAGVWLLHCHLYFHALMGMAAVFALEPDQILTTAGMAGDSDYLEYGRNVTSRWSKAYGDGPG